MRDKIEIPIFYKDWRRKFEVKSFTYEWGPEYSKIEECEVCKKLGSTKKICDRPDVYGWDLPKREKTEAWTNGGKYIERYSKTILCVSCWNKAKPIIKKENDYNEIRKLLNKLTLVIRNEHKKTNQNNW
jgi:hypothetical protein